MTEMYVATHPLRPEKWCVVLYLGFCETQDEAKKLAEEVKPMLEKAFP